MSKYTTPIFYASGYPHLGHAYASIIADFYGLYQTGTDEFGLKIQRLAETNKVTPKEFVDCYQPYFTSLWNKLQCKPEHIIRTTSKEHEDKVTFYWNLIKANGDLYKGEYEGLYCVGCESFILKKDLTKNDELCRYHLTKPELIKEEGYFFKLSKYRDRLIALYEKEAVIVPKESIKEILNLLKNESFMKEDLCCSRKNVTWGIKVPSDEEYTIYVWFDALFNYLDNLPFFAPLNEVIHVIGKDILKFHAIYWIAFLYSLGYTDEQLPKILVHGFINQNNQKISKSLETKLDFMAFNNLIDEYGSSPIRYYLLRNCELNQDFEFSLDMMKQCYNTELLGKIGNLVQRTIGIIHRFNNSICPKQSENLIFRFKNSPKAMIEGILKVVENYNSYFDKVKPWEMKDNPKELESFIKDIVEYILLIQPVIERIVPDVGYRIKDSLLLDKFYLDRKIPLLLEPIVKKYNIRLM